MTYNPNEPRDEHGRWTDSGGTGWRALNPGSPNGRFVADKMPMLEIANQDKHFSQYEDLRALAKEVAEHATKLGFNPEMMTVTDRNYAFEVNGHDGFAAGTANRLDGRITIYSPQVPLGRHWTPGLIAHEIMHQKFNAFMDDYKAEYDRVQKDPDYHKDGERREDGSLDRTKAFMRPDGSLSEPYASKYPLYQTYNRVMVGSDEFRKSDGVSEYSRNWWTDVINGKANYDVGLHETLAEMAKIKLNEATNLKEHKERVKDMRARGVEWTAESEKLFKKNSGTEYRFYKEGKDEVDGKKVYFATTGKRVAKVWAALYDAVTENWDSRHKYKAPKK